MYSCQVVNIKKIEITLYVGQKVVSRLVVLQQNNLRSLSQEQLSVRTIFDSSISDFDTVNENIRSTGLYALRKSDNGKNLGLHKSGSNKISALRSANKLKE